MIYLSKDLASLQYFKKNIFQPEHRIICPFENILEFNFSYTFSKSKINAEQKQNKTNEQKNNNKK